MNRFTLAVSVVFAAFAVCAAQSISSATPSGADIAQVLPVTITCADDQFRTCIKQGSFTTCTSDLNRVYLQMNTSIIQADSVITPGNTTAVAYFKFPVSSTAGPWNLTVEHLGGATLTSVNKFTISSFSTPVIDSISPATAAWKSAPTLTIKASHAHFFYAQSTTAQNNITKIWLEKGSTQIQATGFRIINSNQCTANFTIPDSCEPGKYDFHIEQGNGRPEATLAGFFLIKPILKIQSISPDSAGPGQYLTTTVRARNANFTLEGVAANNVTAVSLLKNSQVIKARSFQPVSDSVLNAGFLFDVAMVPGYYSLIVTQGNGYLGDTMPNAFRITTSSEYLPAVKSVSPDSSSIGQIITLTVYGHSSHFLAIGTGLPNISKVVLFTSGFAMNADSVFIISDSVLTARFAIDTRAPGGLYSLRVEPNTGYPTVTSAAPIFKVLRPSAPLTVVAAIPDTFIVDSTYRIPFIVTGGSGGVVMYTINKMPAGMGFSANNDTLTWKPTSVHPLGDSLVIEVSNSNNQADTVAKLLWTKTKSMTGIAVNSGKNNLNPGAKTVRREGRTFLEITLPSSAKHAIPMQIYSLKGVLVKTWQLQAGDGNRLLVNLGSGSFSKGVFVLQITLGEKVIKTPVVVE